MPSPMSSYWFYWFFLLCLEWNSRVSPRYFVPEVLQPLRLDPRGHRKPLWCSFQHWLRLFLGRKSLWKSLRKGWILGKGGFFGKSECAKQGMVPLIRPGARKGWNWGIWSLLIQPIPWIRGFWGFPALSCHGLELEDLVPSNPTQPMVPWFSGISSPALPSIPH